MTKKNNPIPFPIWFKATLFILVAAKLWLVSSQTLFAIGHSHYDDRLHINLANHLINGNWLGPFDDKTLIKGPFYPIWIAMSFYLGIPLLLSQHLLYIAACGLFTIAVRPLIQKPTWIILVFAILLFNPMSYSLLTMMRVLREGIYPALTILTVSCAIGVLLRWNSSTKNLLLWAVGLGISFSAFWLTREEGLWLLPSILLLIGFAVAKVWFGGVDRLKKFSLFVLPFVIWVFSIGAVSAMNKAYYGVFTVTEFKSKVFLSAIGALMRVKHTDWHPIIPVPQETREKIYAVSPAFSELKPFLEGEKTRSPRFSSCKVLNICNDIGGGWFWWAFRRSMVLAGHYESAKAAEDYYRRLATEINGACEAKKLDCGPERASAFPPWHSEYLKPFLKSISHGAISLVTFKDFSPYSGKSTGSDDSLILFQDVTGENIAPTSSFIITGWAFSPNHLVDLSIHYGNDIMANYEIKFMDNIFLSHRNAGRARFEIKTNCYEECFLHVKNGQALVVRIPLENIRAESKLIWKPELFLYIDSVVKKEDILPNQNRIAMLKARCLSAIAKTYQVVTPIAVTLTMIFYAIATIQCLVARNVTALYIVSTTLIIAISSRLFILSMIDISLFPTFNLNHYLSPAHPLILMTIMLNLFGQFRPDSCGK